MTSISPTARRALTEVMRLTAEQGRAPSYKQLSTALGYGSNGPVARALTELRRAGLITTGIIPTAWSSPHRCCPHCGGNLKKGPAP